MLLTVSEYEIYPTSGGHKTMYTGEIAHTGLWGPTRFTTINGRHYSRHCAIALLKQKSDAAGILKGYLTYVECKLKCKPMVIYAENGKEYVNKDLTSWLAQQGIVLHLTASHSPEKNGIAGRYNETLADLIRAMLLAKNLPKSLWGVAAKHVRNRAYTKPLPDSAPMTRWNGERPNVQSFREFGIPVSILDESNTQDKFDANVHVFVGFNDDLKAIRYYDVKTKEIKISRKLINIYLQ